MDTETTLSRSPEVVVKKGPTPWGVIIAILLILGIVVSGAFYAFKQRTTPSPAAVDAAALSS